MIKRYTCDIDTSTALRNQDLREVAASLVSGIILNSDLTPKDSYIIGVRIRKVRNRKKDSTIEEYIVTGSINI